MFSDKLFDHKYDIDELILAFCSGHVSSKWILNTRMGEICEFDAFQNLNDGDDGGHIHIIESLPISFLEELRKNYKFKKLEPEIQVKVQEIISNCKTVHNLTDYFFEDEAGSYIVKSLKAACLDWLDMRNLIPPSMRHTSDMSMFDSLSGKDEGHFKVKVSIK
jgi:hypothetical protein